MRIDPLKYAQAEDDFEETARLVSQSVKRAYRAGLVIGYALVALLMIGVAIVGKFLLSILF